MTVYGGSGRRRDPVLLGVLAFVGVAVLAGAAFLIYGLTGSDPRETTAPPLVSKPSVTTSLTPAVEQLPTDGGPRFVHAKDSPLCLDFQPDVEAEGAPVLLQTCSGGKSQQWTLTQTGDSNTYELINSATGKCLDVFGESKGDGAKVVQWSCKKSANQLWRLAPTEDGASLFTNVNSEKCLTRADTALQQSCAGAPSQHWLFTKQ